MTSHKFSPDEETLLDQVAKELFARRVFNIREMKDHELKQSALDCYKKAKLFIEARSEFKK